MRTLHAADVVVPVEYSQFFLTAGSADAELTIHTSDDDLVQAGVSDVLCISALNTHEAAVRLEVWDEGPPPEPEGDWELERTVRITRGEGSVYVVPLAGAIIEELPMPLAPGEPVMIRICCRGREKLRQAAADGVTIPPAGTEQWLAQYWPA